MNEPGVQITRNNKIETIYGAVSTRRFPDIAYFDPYGIYNKIASGAPVVLALACILSFFMFTYPLVLDKQYRLRQSLHTIGLRDSAFWFSILTVAIAVALL